MREWARAFDSCNKYKFRYLVPAVLGHLLDLLEERPGNQCSVLQAFRPYCSIYCRNGASITELGTNKADARVWIFKRYLRSSNINGDWARWVAAFYRACKPRQPSTEAIYLYLICWLRAWMATKRAASDYYRKACAR